MLCGYLLIEELVKNSSVYSDLIWYKKNMGFIEIHENNSWVYMSKINSYTINPILPNV